MFVRLSEEESVFSLLFLLTVRPRGGVAMRVGGRGSTAVLAPLLVLLAVTGKLAFLTLPKQELADGGAVALLQAAQRAPLDGELAHLLAERRTLAHEFADVTAAERRRQAAAQEKRALHARELRELDALRGVWRGVERQPATDSRDEAVARKIVHAEVEREERERTDGARAAAAPRAARGAEGRAGAHGGCGQAGGAAGAASGRRSACAAQGGFRALGQDFGRAARE